MSAMQLGPFSLVSPIGEGGMGEVWQAVHGEGVAVAVKVLTRDLARQEVARQAFRAEVRAVARLDHPGIVAVLDHGEVDAAAARASEGRLVAGSPYLAMELASGGSLHDLHVPLGWPTCAWCSWRCSTRWGTRTPTAWCTAISSPPTCWSARRATCAPA